MMTSAGSAKPAKVIYGGPYPELPTVRAPLAQITSNLGQIIDKLQKLPIEEIGEDLRKTVSGTQRLVNSAELLDSLRTLNELIPKGISKRRQIHNLFDKYQAIAVGGHGH